MKKKVGTKRKSPKPSPTSAEVLTIKLRRGPHTIDQFKINNLTYILINSSRVRLMVYYFIKKNVHLLHFIIKCNYEVLQVIFSFVSHCPAARHLALVAGKYASNKLR